MHEQPSSDRRRLAQLRRRLWLLALRQGTKLSSRYSKRAGLRLRWSALSQILAQMEQRPLFDAINFSLPPESPDIGAPGMMPYMPAFQDPNRENATVSKIMIGAFLCSSDGAGTVDWPGATNYVGNESTWLCDLCDQMPSMMFPAERPRGTFYNLSNVKFAGVTDGLSQTALFSEKRRGSGAADPRSDMFQMQTTMSLSDTYQTCTTMNVMMGMPLQSRQGAAWAIGDMTCSTYNHVAPPNTNTCAGMMNSNMMGMMTNMPVQLPPSSYHPGGANLLLGDGSVRFIKESIAVNVWRALGTRNGNEVVSAADF